MEIIKLDRIVKHMDIEELKKFLNIYYDDRDEELQAILSSAISIVEDTINKSLSEQTIQIITEDYEQELYYPPVKEVISVTDQSGTNSGYDINFTKTKIKTTGGVITYKTEPNKETIIEFKAYVYKVAGQIFDGQKIEVNIPKSIC